MESSLTCVRAALIALLSVLVHGCGVVPLVSDQAQVDPSVRSNRSYNLGRSQPTPVIPDCAVQQWIERAVSGGSIGCRRSIDGLSKFDAIAASSGRNGRHGQASSDEDAAGSRFLLPEVEAGTVAGEQGARSIRSQVQAELMTYGDLICDKHLAGIYGNQSGLNFDLGLGTALLSGGAAIASGRAATNLAAGSALFSGTRSLMNSEIYFGYVGPAVVTELRALRADLRKQIVAKRDCGIAEYPAQDAINEALIYHDACSFANGLASLLNKAGVTRISEDKLRVAQLATLSQQLVEKRKQRDDLEVLVATSKPDASLQRKLDRVSSEIREAEAVQRFAGAVDPAGGAAMAKEPPQSALDKLVDSRARMEAIDPKDPRVKELSTAIGEAAANEAYADSLKVRLDLVGAARDSNDIVRRGLQANDPRINVIDATIAAQDTLIADLRDKLAKTGVLPKLSTASLEFGIVDCKRPVAQPGVSR